MSSEYACLNEMFLFMTKHGIIFVYLEKGSLDSQMEQEVDTVIQELEKKVLDAKARGISLYRVISEIISNDTAPIIIAFLKEHLRNSKSLLLNDIYKAEEVESTLNLLKKNTPTDLHFHFNALQSLQNSKKVQDSDFFVKLSELVKEALIRNTTYEILRAIASKVGMQEDEVGKPTESLVYPLARQYTRIEDDKKGLFMRHLACVITEDDLILLLNYATKNEDFALLLMASLRLYNEEAYNQALDLIVTEKRFFKELLLKASPEVDIETALSIIKTYNWGSLAALLEARPSVIPLLAEKMADSAIGISRRFFIEKIKEQDEIFSYFISDLRLTFEELSDLIRSSTEFLQQYFVRADTDEVIAEVAKILSQKNELEIISFLERNKIHKNFVTLIKGLTGMMRFTGSLRTYILENLATKRDFFHILITYLNMKDISELLPEYYEKEVSLEALLRKCHPQELLIEIHKFRDILIVSTLISECVVSDRFSDHDWVFAMKSLEYTRSEAKMRTALSLLKKRPQLLKEVLVFIRKGINESFWKSKMNTVGLEKCFDILGDRTIGFLETLKSDDVVKALQLTKNARRILEGYFKDGTTKDYTPCTKALKHLLLTYKDKRQK